MNEADDLDRAADYSEMWRENAVRNALLVGASNPMRTSNICPNCKGRNDRANTGHNLCSACAEDEAWFL